MTDTSMEQRLQGAGLRSTAQRLAVLGAVQATPHAQVDVLLRAVAPAVSVQGVYNVLAALTDAGVLRRIQPATSPARYELEQGDNHHHLVCRGCGGVQDVACHLGSAPCLQPAQSPGFAVDEAEVIYWGWCDDCAAAPTDIPPGTIPSMKENTHD